MSPPLVKMLMYKQLCAEASFASGAKQLARMLEIDNRVAYNEGNLRVNYL